MSRYPHIYGQHWGEHGSVPENNPRPIETVNTLSKNASHKKKVTFSVTEKKQTPGKTPSCADSSAQTRA